MKKYILIAVSFILAVNIYSQIVIDEDFEDWENVEDSYTDSANDGRNGLDFGNLKVYNDSKYIYIHFTTGSEFNLQSGNNISLMIDIDDNIDTGFKKNGLGVDLVYDFVAKKGRYYRNEYNYVFFHQDLELLPLPTVSSNQFEIAFLRKFEAVNQLINMNNKISIMLVQDINNGDVMPDEDGGFKYEIKDNDFEIPEYDIAKQDDKHLRIMSFNVEKDGYFKNEPPYRRMIKAIEPDIICFQEIYNHSSTDVKNKIQSYFGGTWYHSKKGTDLIVVSRYPIKNAFLLGGNAGFLINKDDKDILVVNCHLYCCNKDKKRQKEVDIIMKYIREAKNGQGSFPLKENTPIIITGDMNFVGSNRQRKTLIEGDIYDESNYGNDFMPDWDNSFFEDAIPNTVGYPATFTWNVETAGYNGYPKGRLDYMIYSGSILEKENSFVLFTRELDSSTLNEYGLNAEDADNASDHFPVVVDFRIKSGTSTQEAYYNNPEFEITNCFPIPAKDILNIKFKSAKEQNITIDIIEINGRKIRSKKISSKQGENVVKLKIKDLKHGIYIAKIYSSSKLETLKFVVE